MHLKVTNCSKKWAGEKCLWVFSLSCNIILKQQVCRRRGAGEHGHKEKMFYWGLSVNLFLTLFHTSLSCMSDISCMVRECWFISTTITSLCWFLCIVHSWPKWKKFKRKNILKQNLTFSSLRHDYKAKKFSWWLLHKLSRCKYSNLLCRWKLQRKHIMRPAKRRNWLYPEKQTAKLIQH